MNTASTRQLRSMLRKLGMDQLETQSLDLDTDQVIARTTVWHAQLEQELHTLFQGRGLQAPYTVYKHWGQGYEIKFTTRKKAK